MRRLAFALCGTIIATSLAIAAENPVASRQALMQANQQAANAAGGMLKGEIEYSPVVAKAALASMYAVSMTYGDFFPEGSQDSGSGASPKIWEDRAGFEEKLAAFRTASKSAVEASGRPGPADLDAFKALIFPIFDTCQGCHETYRLKR